MQAQAPDDLLVRRGDWVYAELQYTLLLVLIKYSTQAQAPDDLSVRRSDWVYVELQYT
jgi:hypothetical protein